MCAHGRGTVLLSRLLEYDRTGGVIFQDQENLDRTSSARSSLHLYTEVTRHGNAAAATKMNKERSYLLEIHFSTGEYML